MFQIEIVNDDYYVLRSSKKYEKCVFGYTVHMLMVILQHLYNFINAQCPFLYFRQDGLFLKREL